MALLHFVEMAKAAKLAFTVIESIGEILQYENEKVAYSHAPKGTKRGEPDCRIYRRMFTISNLSAARKWWDSNQNNTSVRDVQSIQISTLRCMREGSIEDRRTSRLVGSADIESMFANRVLEYAEVRKFTAFLNGRKPPAAMQNLKKNIEGSICHDEEIALNKNNERTILPVLIRKFEEFSVGAQLVIRESEALSETGHRSTTDTVAPNDIVALSRNEAEAGTTVRGGSCKDSQEISGNIET